ncbi:MAG: 3-deoxy-manno-octulosonate cytidylyltransferase [Pseudomonadales bacterium]|nr:3-deoxy-manno-octulosonate cytidylyltransferase [Pseudomonadales bacterium]
MRFSVVIPARYASQRLPGKVLLDIGGKPMLQRVYEQAVQSDACRVVVATDNVQIAELVESFGGESCITSDAHISGTDRIHEVVSKLQMADDTVIVNVQGDEPLIPPKVINQVAENLVRSGTRVATLFEKIDSMDDFFDPNVVKLVADKNDMALYFSRATIPFERDKNAASVELTRAHLKRHVGIYAYRASLLREFVRWECDEIEQLEKLEQLRILRNGIKIHVAEACTSIPAGVDTDKDLARVRELFPAV